MLKCEKITVTLGNKRILNDINFCVEQGQIVGLLGQNGAGKTTLLRTICGLIKPDSGCIEIDGLSIKENREEFLSKFSAIIEGPSFYPEYSAYQNMILYARLYGKPDIDKINALLDIYEIRDKKKVHSFSLGMKQKLGMAMAMYHESKLLLLDEPLNGCDPVSIVKIKKLLKELATEKKVSILISSHILSELEALCDKMIVIDEGHIAKEFLNTYEKDIQSDLEKKYIDIVSK